MKILTALNHRIYQAASARLLLLLTIILFGLGYAITSSISPSAELMALAHGRNVPDAQFWRSADALYSQLTDYGEYGRHLYLTRISPIDLFIPFAQAMFLSVAIALVFRRAFNANSNWQWLNILPFGAMVGDYLENACLVSIILAYPNRLDVLAIAAGLFTAVKFIVSMASIGCLTVGMVVWLGKRAGSA
jgi:hypothetical protein